MKLTTWIIVCIRIPRVVCTVVGITHYVISGSAVKIKKKC